MEPAASFICGCIVYLSNEFSKEDKCCPCCGETEKTNHVAEIGSMFAKTAIADVGIGERDAWANKCEWVDDKDDKDYY